MTMGRHNIDLTPHENPTFNPQAVTKLRRDPGKLEPTESPGPPLPVRGYSWNIS